MTKGEKLTIIENIIRIQNNCKFYEDEKRIEALKQEIGRLSGVIHIANDLNIDISFLFYNTNHFLELGADLRQKEDNAAIERYKKNQKEMKKKNE